MSKEAMKLAFGLLKTAQNNLAPSKHSAHVYGDGELWDEYDEAIKALEAALEAHKALAKQEQRSVSEHLGERLHEAFSIKEQERWLSEIAEEVDDPTLTSFSQVAGCIRDLKERLSEQGEPVAWMDGNELIVRVDWVGKLDWKESWVDVDRAIPNKWTPVLYTTPPQGEARGLSQQQRKLLTDEQRLKIAQQRTAAEGEDIRRAWVGLTKEQMLEILKEIDPETQRLPIGFRMFADAIEAKLKEKNT